MQAPAHLALSWFAAEVCALERARDRRVVGLAGLAPDADVLVYPVAYLWFGLDLDRAYREVWVVVHHHYTHGIGFAVVTAVVAYALAARPWQGEGTAWRHALKVAGLAALVSMTHVFCDLVASGPRFPVYPWWPLSDLAWTVSWSWELKDWPNQILTAGALATTLLYAGLAGRSPLESLNYALDRWVVNIVQHGSDSPGTRDDRRLGMRRGTLVRVVVYLVLAAVAAALVIPVWHELF